MPSQTITSSTLWSDMQTSEYSENVNTIWTTLGEFKDYITDRVESGQISPAQGINILSSTFEELFFDSSTAD